MSALVQRIVAVAELAEPAMMAHDLETETIHRNGEWDPSPYGPTGATILVEAICKAPGHPQAVKGLLPGYEWPDHTIVVGANWKFDWQHMRRAQPAIKPPELLWDVLIAEYLITGQEHKFPSLNDVMVKYTTGGKADLIGEYLKKGIPPQAIPIEELKVYAREDVRGTLAVAKAQWAACSEDLRKLVLVQSMASLAYADAEYNGMPLDKELAMERRDRALERVGNIQHAIRALWEHKSASGAGSLGHIDADQFVTPRAISALLFGFPATIEFDYKLATPVGRKKKGTLSLPAPQLRSYEYLDSASFGSKKHSDGKSWLVSEDVLSRIKSFSVEPWNDIAGALLKLRESHKLGTTYYQNLIEFSERYGDDLIHPTIHAMSTSTGRTSSANPNAQNQPDSVREVIVAPDGHKFVEFDFSQLEVVALAHLSGCTALQNSLRAGDDIHYLTGLAAGLWIGPASMTKSGRRNVKSIVFGLIYGGGVKTLSAQSGVPEPIVKKIIGAFYAMFPGTEKWQERMVAVVKTAPHEPEAGLWREVVPGRTGTVEKFTLESVTGRRYTFTQKPSPEYLAKKGVPLSYSPPEIKNYFVQGFATGDVVPLAVVLLWEVIREKLPSNKLTMMVHDSVLQIVPLKNVKYTEAWVTRVLPSVIQDALEKLWGIDLDLPLKVETKVTDRWTEPSGTI